MSLTPRHPLRLVGALAILSGLTLGHALAPAQEEAETAKPDEKIRVLVVTGGHDYDQPAFERMLNADTGIAWTRAVHPEALSLITQEGPARPDVIVLYDLHQAITEAEKARYTAIIRGGVGLVALHHSLASYQDWPEYERMVGGKFFLAKRVEAGVEIPPSPWRHDVDIPVEVAAADHFITRGLSNFTIHDETYGGLRVDPAALPLLRTSCQGSSPILAWTLPYGKARVVYLQLGHDDGAYSNASYRTLVSRAVRWAARRAPGDPAWTPLFNGRDLDGWRVEGKARFTVEDGLMVGRQGPGGEAGDLLSTSSFDDFELEVTWAMDWPGNSGVWFRYQEPERSYQADILEWKDPVCWSGSLYRPGKMFVALNEDPSIVRRNGWNTFLVRAEGQRLVVHLNGRRVADVRDDLSMRGRIGFQVHAGAPFAKMAIRVADVRVRKLP